jgi:hypothetical protein
MVTPKVPVFLSLSKAKSTKKGSTERNQSLSIEYVPPRRRNRTCCDITESSAIQRVQKAQPSFRTVEKKSLKKRLPLNHHNLGKTSYPSSHASITTIQNGKTYVLTDPASTTPARVILPRTSLLNSSSILPGSEVNSFTANQNKIILPGIKIAKLPVHCNKIEYAGNKNEYSGKGKRYSGQNIWKKRMLGCTERTLLS